MPTSQQVRQWASEQDPQLAKPNVRGRLPKKAIDAYNQAHAAEPYETASKPVPHILPVPPRDGNVGDEASHDGTVENPSSAVDAEQTEPLRDSGSPFTYPPEAAEGVTGEVMPQYKTATDDGFSDGSDYDVTKTPNVHYVDFSGERFTEAP